MPFGPSGVAALRMAWIDIAVSTAGRVGGVVRGTEAGRELLSGGAETDSEWSYRRKTSSAGKKGAHGTTRDTCLGRGRGTKLVDIGLVVVGRSRHVEVVVEEEGIVGRLCSLSHN